MQSQSKPLPYGPKYDSADEYISALLSFVTSSNLHQALCGGVHILDFLTRDPDLYASLIPGEWRSWFAVTEIDDILDLLLRENIPNLKGQSAWREYPVPPQSLLDFIIHIRDLCLDRSYAPPPNKAPARLDRNISVGMNVKKEHEVSHFASFVANLTDDLHSSSIGSNQHEISHLVDFGSGQNYLGRVLAGPNYQKHVVALESRLKNIDGARKMDIHAKVAKKPVIWRNKKMWKQSRRDTAEEERRATANDKANEPGTGEAPASNQSDSFGTQVSEEVHRRTTYIEHIIKDGDLADVTKQVQDGYTNTQLTNNKIPEPEFLVMSLHSCGNLVHHGLRSLIINPAVKAVAMIGCCYNLCTERLGPPSYKLPSLRFRSPSERLVSTSLTCDPHGFPMSRKFLENEHDGTKGMRFNITARMMAVQAPSNWTREEYDSFFTRHFYRALIQRIFLDKGFVGPPVPADEVIGGSTRGWAGGTEPIIIGSLTKACYKSFVAYVRGAVRKISTINPDQGIMLEKCFEGLSDEAISDYEHRYLHKRHELCVLWSLMSFAAQLVECAIVADRWQFLTEQEDVASAWVQTVFDYKHSPRNLAIVGVKK